MTENPSDTTTADAEAEAAEQPQAPEVAPDAEAPADGEVQPAGTEDAPEDVTPAAPEQAPLSGDTGSEQPAAEEAPAAAEEPAGPAEQPTSSAPQPADPTELDDAAAPAEQPTSSAPQPSPADVHAPPPGAGPKILGMAEDVTPPPVPAVKESLKDLQRRERPKRRRLNATQRHRNVFFARLNEFRRQAQQGNDPEAVAEAEAKAAEAAEAAEAQAADGAPSEPPATDAGEAPAAASEAPAEAPAVTDAGEAPAATDAPAAEAPATDAPAAATPAAEAPASAAAEDDQPRQQRRSAPPPQVDQARLVAAIDRAGGPEVILEALQPKRDEQDQPLKWATVCADACKGLKPSDPVFSAWVRLAATPVSAIKRELGLNERPERGGRRGGGPGRGPGRGPRREGRGGDRGDRVSREDFQRLSHGGTVGANIRIIGLDADAEKKEREARRKAEREAKRQAERDRLARLGY